MWIIVNREIVNSEDIITHEARYTDPMLAQCWASVADDGSTLNQQWIIVSYWLGI